MTDVDLKLAMRQGIQKVATGPEYSKDLDYDEAYYAMRHILTGEADDVQTAVYFIALRMKRETDEENRATLQALIDTATISQAKAQDVIDLSDPYDGYSRGMPASTFLPAVLASLGEYTVLHGLNEVGPKYGVTHHKILKAAGIDVALMPEQATAQLDRIGWTYIDQAQYVPRLHDLISMRQRIIKRQILTTVETMLSPIRGSEHTHYMGGYVHKAYPPIYEALARHAGFASAMFIRGVEGGVIPSLQQSGKLFSYHGDGELAQRDLSPNELGIEASTRAMPLPDDVPAHPLGDYAAATVDSDVLAERVVEQGLAALQGEQGLMRDSLVYAGAIALTHVGRFESMQDAAQAVKQVLDNGKALAAFKAAA